MKIIFNTILLVTVFFLNGLSLYGQTTIHPKLGFIGYHPFDEPNRRLFDNNIDANKTFIVEPLIMVSIETMLRDDSFSWRVMPGIYLDAAAKPAFFINAGLKLRLFQAWRHSFHFSAGGSLLGRELWSTYSNYVDEPGFSKNGSWEYKFEPFGELEYTMFLGKQSDLTCSVIYGHQRRTFTFTIGYRYWLSTILKHPSNCGSCPFQKSDKKYRK
jgi:hypothetical protein